MLRFRLDHSSNYWKLFLWTGIATAFFDFLTYPVVGLGITLGVMLVLQKDPPVLQVKKIVKASCAWGIGYSGMWTGKWLAAFILTGSNVFAEGIGSVKYRTSGNGVEAVLNNCEQLKNVPMLLPLVILVIAVLILLLSGKYRLKMSMSYMAGMLIISLYPFLWYCVASNHSTIHPFITYRNLSITVFAVSYMLINSVVTVSDRK